MIKFLSEPYLVSLKEELKKNKLHLEKATGLSKDIVLMYLDCPDGSDKHILLEMKKGCIENFKIDTEKAPSSRIRNLKFEDTWLVRLRLPYEIGVKMDKKEIKLPQLLTMKNCKVEGSKIKLTLNLKALNSFNHVSSTIVKEY